MPSNGYLGRWIPHGEKVKYTCKYNINWLVIEHFPVIMRNRATIDQPVRRKVAQDWMLSGLVLIESAGSKCSVESLHCLESALVS